MSGFQPSVVAVDDDRSNLRLLETILQNRGFNSHSVWDSREALSEISRLNPDIVLLDIMMPHLNGYELTEQIRNEPGLEDVLVISISTMGGKDHERQAATSGIDCQLTKPVDTDELLRTITAGLKKRRAKLK